jgi:putative methyltransferase (TIGR04325 family)
MADVTEIYSDYATALASCGSGYNDVELAEVVAFKTRQRIEPNAIASEQALNSLISVGITATDIRNRPLNVLDFGGGCGFHYFQVVAAMRIPLRWAIVETHTMAVQAKKLAQNYFAVFTTMGDAAAALGVVDLVHASGSIQYVPDPKSILKSLVALRPRYMMLARLPYWQEPTAIGVQVSPLSHNGVGPLPPNLQDREIKFPVTLMNIKDVFQILDGYNTVLCMESPSGSYVVRDKPVPGVSIIFRASWA